MNAPGDVDEANSIGTTAPAARYRAPIPLMRG